MDVVEVEVIGEFTDRAGDEWAKIRIKGRRDQDDDTLLDVKVSAVIVLIEKTHYERPF